MVFFNYATMQMAAKIVYYGPGLCGKTTNLHIIYGRTAPNSRGEMVSLETETDRTLFFDLLPLDVGVIGGFKTRLQLYTVPGQVFYNTTRKLVLKGVDGIVFVADSQRPMLDPNRESLKNLRENLAEIGLSLDEIPRVYQYNKRDLANIASVDELNDAINPDRSVEWYEASAMNGVGVFETLKAISKLTLKSLRSRMTGEAKRPAVVAAPAGGIPAPPSITQSITQGVASIGDRLASRPPVPPAPTLPPPGTPQGPPAPPASPSGTLERLARFSELADQAGKAEKEKSDDRLSAALTKSGIMRRPKLPDTGATVEVPTLKAEEEHHADVRFAENPTGGGASAEAVKHVKVRSNVDILSELDKLRKVSTQKPSGSTGVVAALGDTRGAARHGMSLDDLLAPGPNHKREVSRAFDVTVPRDTLTRARQVTIGLRFITETGEPLTLEKTLEVDVTNPKDVQRLLLSLKISVQGE